MFLNGACLIGQGDDFGRGFDAHAFEHVVGDFLHRSAQPPHVADDVTMLEFAPCVYALFVAALNSVRVMQGIDM